MTAQPSADIAFDNSYARLPARFFASLAPTPVAHPELLLLNRALASDLGISAEWLQSESGVNMLAGNALPKGAHPLAQAYAGHQFGNFVPQLGDGRAILLGEVVGQGGKRYDIQLKGAGRTPFSRMGDGRAWLGPVLREFLVSEAMHALSVPTTRALAVTATGETVLREAPLPGAVLTRVASSHIRVGTFQYFAARQDTEALDALTKHVIARHYPEADSPMGMLHAVINRQARLVAQWMGLGFIHGVMNTDNTSIAGETIDYGPCAFMDAYHPATVFSSIDQFGRYAYQSQPEILAWNLAQLASALLPLIDPDRDTAIAGAQAAIDSYADKFHAAWVEVFAAKLALPDNTPGDIELMTGFLEAMAKGQADFTNAFRGLADGSARNAFADPAPFDAWLPAWETRTKAVPDRDTRLAAANPAIIPRNHRIEEAIQAAVQGNLGPATRLWQATRQPYTAPSDLSLTEPASQENRVTQTFCGT